MSYTPNTWETGDTITADKLNHMEQGIVNAGGMFLVGVTLDIGAFRTTCDKTVQEIEQAFISGKTVILGDAREGGSQFRSLVSFECDNSDPQDFYLNMVTVNAAGSVISWAADSFSSYPYTTSLF